MKTTDLSVITNDAGKIVEIVNDNCGVFNYTEGIKEDFIKDLFLIMSRDGDWFKVLSYFVRYDVHFIENKCAKGASVFDSNSNLLISVSKV